MPFLWNCKMTKSIPILYSGFAKSASLCTMTHPDYTYQRKMKFGTVNLFNIFQGDSKNSFMTTMAYPSMQSNMLYKNNSISRLVHCGWEQLHCYLLHRCVFNPMMLWGLNRYTDLFICCLLTIIIIWYVMQVQFTLSNSEWKNFAFASDPLHVLLYFKNSTQWDLSALFKHHIQVDMTWTGLKNGFHLT